MASPLGLVAVVGQPLAAQRDKWWLAAAQEEACRLSAPAQRKTRERLIAARQCRARRGRPPRFSGRRRRRRGRRGRRRRRRARRRGRPGSARGRARRPRPRPGGRRAAAAPRPRRGSRRRGCGLVGVGGVDGDDGPALEQDPPRARGQRRQADPEVEGPSGLPGAGARPGAAGPGAAGPGPAGPAGGERGARAGRAREGRGRRGAADREGHGVAPGPHPSNARGPPARRANSRPGRWRPSGCPGGIGRSSSRRGGGRR